MTIWGLHILDLLMIAVYFVIVLYIGFRAMKRISNQEDYFLGGRRFGRMIQTFAAFGQGTSAESAVATTTKVAQEGIAGIGAAGMSGGFIMMPFIWITTMWYRRIRLLSLADFFEERFGCKIMAGFYALIQGLFFMIVAGLGFQAMSKTVAAIAVVPETKLTIEQKAEQNRAEEWKVLKDTDARLLTTEQGTRLDRFNIEKPKLQFSYINEFVLMVVLAVIILLYAVSGGLEAAFVTDMIQGIFIIILTIMMIPFAMHQLNMIHGESGFLGAFRAMHKVLPESNFQLFGSAALAEVTWYYLLALGVMITVNTMAQANQLTAAGSAKDDETARKGFVTGIFIKRYCTIIWALLGLLIYVLYGDKVSDTDYIWGYATRSLLMPGLVGLMIACLMAALMSTADALMLTTSALITRSIYRPLVPDKSEKHYVTAGRLFCLIYIVGGIVVAMSFSDIGTLLKFMFTFNCIVAAAFLVGMLWRRATKTAAWVSMGVTFLFTLLLPILIPIMMPNVRTSEYFTHMTEGREIHNTYIARQIDIDQRSQEIKLWKSLNQIGQAQGLCPDPIEVGKDFTKVSIVTPKSVFWMDGIGKTEDGEKIGKGMLKVDLVLLDLLGWDMTKNSYSLNETITFLTRIFIPFGIVLLVSMFTKPQPKERLAYFYGKMRTPVNPDHALDDVEMEQTRNNPRRFDHLKLFGEESNWELRKWNRNDWIGQVWVLLAIAGAIGLLWLVVNIGK